MTSGGRRRDVFPAIVGGEPAKKHSWPWMMALYKKPCSGSAPMIGCGASLISPQYAITAAHCIEHRKPSELSCLAGAQSFGCGKEYDISCILLHPEYENASLVNDIALLHLKGKVQFSKNVYPVCLPPADLQDADLNMVTITGWGLLSEDDGGDYGKELQEVSVPVVPFEDCKATFTKLPESSMCAGEDGKDSCSGDSGGPLVAELKEDTWVQVGIVSSGYKCGEPGFPGIYTRVSKYVKWIQDNTDLGND